MSQALFVGSWEEDVGGMDGETEVGGGAACSVGGEPEGSEELSGLSQAGAGLGVGGMGSGAEDG